MIPISPRRKPPLPESNDAVDLMLACHERIRSFGSLAVRLAEKGTASDAQAAQAAGSLHTYFSVALPLHVADEDLSVRPRLERSGAPAEVAAALCRMSMQHLDIDQVLAEALPLWLALSRDELPRAHCAERLLTLAQTLTAHFEVHLDLEERSIFPTIRSLLPATEQNALASEIRERRRQQPGI